MKIRGTTVFLIVVVVILLVVAVIANINTFKELGWFGGKSRPKPSEPVVKKSNTAVKKPNTNDPPIKNSPPPAQKEENKENSENSNESANSGDWWKDLPRNQYGRTNPFQPLVGARRPSPQRTNSSSKPALEGIIKQFANQGPLVQLTAIFGEQAIFKVEGSSKTVKAGDTLAGMDVASIGEDEVILNKGDKNLVMKLGEEPRRISTGKAE